MLSVGTSDFHPQIPQEVTGAVASNYESATAPLVLRPKAAIEPFFDGFTLEPRAWSRPCYGARSPTPARRT